MTLFQLFTRMKLMNLILSHLKGINRHIQFTVETEENGCLPYLDLKISRNSNGSLSFDVYGKPTQFKFALHILSKMNKKESQNHY